MPEEAQMSANQASCDPAEQSQEDNTVRESQNQKKARLLRTLEELGKKEEELKAEKELRRLEREVEAANKRIRELDEDRIEETPAIIPEKASTDHTQSGIGINSETSHTSQITAGNSLRYRRDAFTRDSVATASSSKAQASSSYDPAAVLAGAGSFGKLEGLEYYREVDGDSDGGLQPFKDMDLHQLCRLAAIEEEGDQSTEQTQAGSLISYSIFLKPGAIEDLERAINRAGGEIPVKDDSPDYAPCLKDLIVMLIKKYQQKKSLDDLQEAIFRALEIFAATPPDHHDRLSRMNDLISLLFVKVGHTGLQSDIDEAIVFAREVGAEVNVLKNDSDDDERPNHLHNTLGFQLRAVARRTSNLVTALVPSFAQMIYETWTKLLQKPKGVASHAMEANANSTGTQGILGVLLMQRYEITRAREDIEEAISFGKRAISTTPKGDLEAAILGVRMAIDTMPDDNPTWSMVTRTLLQHMLTSLIDQTGDTTTARLILEELPKKGLKMEELQYKILGPDFKENYTTEFPLILEGGAGEQNHNNHLAEVPDLTSELELENHRSTKRRPAESLILDPKSTPESTPLLSLGGQAFPSRAPGLQDSDNRGDSVITPGPSPNDLLDEENGDDGACVRSKGDQYVNSDSHESEYNSGNSDDELGASSDEGNRYRAATVTSKRRKRSYHLANHKKTSQAGSTHRRGYALPETTYTARCRSRPKAYTVTQPASPRSSLGTTANDCKVFQEVSSFGVSKCTKLVIATVSRPGRSYVACVAEILTAVGLAPERAVDALLWRVVASNRGASSLTMTTVTRGALGVQRDLKEKGSQQPGHTRPCLILSTLAAHPDALFLTEIFSTSVLNSPMYMSKGANLSTYPISQGREMNVVVFKRDPEPWRYPDFTYEVSREDMLIDFGIYNPDSRLLKLLDWAKPLRWGIFHHPRTLTYYNSQICMHGDVAHAGGPYQGAGTG
ncbi:hypothetical protein K469DRAFT_751833 [Zopfia rhizophila CBS 207.26]|uniref:FAD-binding domain-containing protein n=1 Tax=Zopfia rhizophila CBS 207.26 TaxID=1314779 RepID=A0A6A6DTI6_9PEZI|nr:hypothetical protein K469DRAFT_751833 [Zopfia rhizophila CBS 207.26]